MTASMFFVIQLFVLLLFLILIFICLYVSSSLFTFYLYVHISLYFLLINDMILYHSIYLESFIAFKNYNFTDYNLSYLIKKSWLYFSLFV